MNRNSDAHGGERRGKISPRGGVRRRLTLAFVLIAGASTAFLATTSYVMVSVYRNNAAVDRAHEQAAFRRALASRELPSQPSEQDLSALVNIHRTRGSAETLVVSAQGSASSSPRITPGVIPRELSQEAASGIVSDARVEVGGMAYLVVGGPVEGSAAEAYHFVSVQRLNRELSMLAMTLVGGCVAVVAVAAVVGRSLARRTLRPVARASHAARSMAAGVLETRISVDSDDEFGAWAASFNEMAETLQEKISALAQAGARERRFTADVAHELRTPLASVVSAASYVADERFGALPEKYRRPIELLLQQVRWLGVMVEDLLEISRLEAQQSASSLTAVSLPALVADLVARRGWDGVRVTAEDVTVPADPRLLERVIANLLDNALRHGGRGVQVRISRQGPWTVIDVLDRGPGIPEEHARHLFERFYKTDPSRSGEGSGLGLAIARRNADLLGATIDVWSRPGGGARFAVRIPDAGGEALIDEAVSPPGAG